MRDAKTLKEFARGQWAEDAEFGGLRLGAAQYRLQNEVLFAQS